MGAGMLAQGEGVPTTDVAAFQGVHGFLAEVRVARPNRYVWLEWMGEVDQIYVVDSLEEKVNWMRIASAGHLVTPLVQLVREGVTTVTIRMTRTPVSRSRTPASK
jgi:hypothetical protein